MISSRLKPLRSLLWLAPFLASIGLYFYTLARRQKMFDVAVHAGYFITLLLFLLWVGVLTAHLRRAGFSLKSFFLRHYPGLILAAAVASFIFISVKPAFRVLSDETNLLSVSQSMAFAKTVSLTTQGLYYYDNLNLVDQGYPLRPLMFPFLTSLFHTLLGYSADNVFILNFLAMFAFLSGVYIVARRFLDVWAASASAVLCAACPVFSIYGTTGGFDLVSALFFGLTLISLYGFLYRPSGALFSLFWATALMLCGIRQESWGYFIIMLGFLLWFRAVKAEHLKAAALPVGLTPVFFLPTLWQRLLNSNYENPPGTPLFGRHSFKEHLLGMLKDQLNFTFTLPHANILNLLAFGLAAVLLFEVFVRKRSFPAAHQRRFALIFISLIGAGLVIYLSHFLGLYSHPTQARFFMVFDLACAVMPAFFIAADPEGRKRWGRPLLLFALAMFLLYHPVAVEGRFMNSLTVDRESSFIGDFMNQPGHKRVLFIVNRAGQMTSSGYGGVGFGYANDMRATLQNNLRMRLFSDIIVIQRISEAIRQPIKDDTLDPSYVLESPPLAEIQTDAETFLRVSRVKHPTE